jgi:hypothetical protein
MTDVTNQIFADLQVPPRTAPAYLGFAWFQSSHPARAMFRKLGLEDYLTAAPSWRALRCMIVDFNDPDEGRFVKLVRHCDGVCSSGERVLLHAIATVCDFAWLADELGTAAKRRGEAPWQRMSSAGGDWLRAVAACILAADDV